MKILDLKKDEIESFVKDIYSKKSGKDICPFMLSETRSGEMIYTELPEIGDRQNGGRIKSLIFAELLNNYLCIKSYTLVFQAYFIRSENPDIGDWVGNIENHPLKTEALQIIFVNEQNNNFKLYIIKPDGSLTSNIGNEFTNGSGDFTKLVDWKKIKEIPETTSTMFMSLLVVSPDKFEEIMVGFVEKQIKERNIK